MVREVGDEPVSSIMERKVEVVHKDTPIDDVLQDCSRRRSTDLIVVDSEGRYVGMVTAFEILSYINPLMGIHSGRKTMGHSLMVGHCPLASDLMTRVHLAISESTTVGEALRHMRKDHHRYMVVLDDRERVIGRLDLCDLLEFLVVKGLIQPSETCEV